VKRTAGQFVMLALVIAGSLLMSFQELFPWEQRAFQWLFGVMGVLLLGFFIDGLILFIDLLRHGVEQSREPKSLKDQNR
jgi:protein-S-isoprenylcysteine O-methyltransferase Ste14